MIGLTTGLIVSISIAYFGGAAFDWDDDFTKTFPDIDKDFPNTRFEFPDRLVNTTTVSRIREDDESNSAAESETEDEDPVALQSSEPSAGGEETVQVQEQSVEAEPSTDVAGYVLQAGAFSEREHAESFRASLLLEGYNAYTTELQASDTPVPYRVIIGPYHSADESAADVARLKERNVSAFLVRMIDTAN